MNLLEWLRDPARHLRKYLELGLNCFNDVRRLDECDQLWANLQFFAGTICVILLVLMVKHLCLDYVAHRRQRRNTLLGRDIGSAEAMQKRRWNDGRLAGPILGQKELIQRIKHAKASRRISDRNRRSGNPQMGVRSGSR
ncbi:MAG: hypothetical protein ABI771_09045 [Betaproteobacteria bacterium]